MAKEQPEDFKCPHCGVRYKLVRLRSDSIGPVEAVTVDCLVCMGPLAGTDGPDILKYVLLGRPLPMKRQPES